jgi:2-polyprenyl-3-methyl-5-hydroxy-6-metoxy-1,4-benzoquinol methylase
MDRTDSAYAGQAVYTSGFLRVYDRVLYGFVSPRVWRCTKHPLLNLYERNVSARHLDVGVGTGVLLDQCRMPLEHPQITLMDANANCLAAAAERLARYQPLLHRGNVLDSWALDSSSFDSVAMTHILHCLPGDSILDKAVVFDHAADALAPGGVLFGATILGDENLQTPTSRLVLRGLNRKGAMSNLGDQEADLDSVLAARFDRHRIELCGAVALFSAGA